MVSLESQISKTESTKLFQRISKKNNAAVVECIDKYSGFVWKTVRQFINDDDEVEEIIRNVFLDIWKSASTYDATKYNDCRFIISFISKRLEIKLAQLEH